ncbi:unnamed protein product [Brugia pahangi]|uniref:HCO3_cotransp domain-containing protein n=1 Tax=Brugia pahangi TaxID=6280 RepID=A0A0N4TFC2_BRUPA|nr:unnamed protein product [Brugia pahangi]
MNDGSAVSRKLRHRTDVDNCAIGGIRHPSRFRCRWQEKPRLKRVMNKTIFSEIEQLKEVLGKFNKDYKQGNMTRLASDFRSALKEYGDGFVFVLISLQILTF